MIDAEWERWDRLEEILRELEEVPAGEREVHLARICPDVELRRTARELLADEAASSGYLYGMFERLAPCRGEPADLTGRRIGAWRLLRLVARGGMGAVYEAERADGAFEQRVALKLLAVALAGGEAHERFLAERRVLAGLGHPAIAHIVDGGVADDGTPWFAMEYVEGMPLDVYCDRRRLTVRERLELFLQVCDAVEHAHRRLVVHRDLKPANVLVTEEGQVKLLDFGIAKLLGAEGMGEGAPPTRTALRLMTPEYASPEQVRGEEVTTASDVYQLGLLLYELLCGHRPYGEVDRRVGELERAVCERVPTRPSVAVGRQAGVKGAVEAVETGTDSESADRSAGTEAGRFRRASGGVEEICRARSTTPARLRRQLRGDLDNVVLKALSKEAGRRYGSADRLAEDIRQYLSGLPVAARADTWVYRGRKFLERHAVGATAAALVAVLVLLLVAGMAAFHTARIQRERDRAQEEAAKADQMNRFLTGLFQSADPREAAGAELTARMLLDRGVEQVDRDLATQQETRADMLHVLGRTYLAMEHLESAEPLLARALNLRRRYLGAAHPDVAALLGDLGLLRLEQGQYTRARKRLEEAVSILEASTGTEASELVEALNVLGRVYRALGEHERARITLERALAAGSHVSSEDSVQTALVMQTLAGLYRQMGALERAEGLYERALAAVQREHGPDHPRVGTVLINLANLRMYEGKLEGVEEMYRRSTAIADRAYGPDSARTGVALNNLGDFLLHAGRYDEAIDVLGRAFEALRASLGPNHPHVAILLATMGDVHFGAGHLRQARESYAESVAVAEKALEGVRFDAALVHSLARLGGVEVELGNGTEAESLMDRALQAWADAPESIDPQLTPALLDLGRWLVGQGRCTEATPLLQRGARIELPPPSPWSSTVAELRGLLAECGASGAEPRATVTAVTSQQRVEGENAVPGGARE